MAKLDHITIEGFRSIKAVKEFRINQLTVLIGANGAGKTNFVRAFFFLSSICRGRLQQYVALTGGADKQLHFGSRVTETMRFQVSFEDGKHTYEIWLEPDATDRLVPVSERACLLEQTAVFDATGEAARIGRPGSRHQQR